MFRTSTTVALIHWQAVSRQSTRSPSSGSGCHTPGNCLDTMRLATIWWRSTRCDEEDEEEDEEGDEEDAAAVANAAALAAAESEAEAEAYADKDEPYADEPLPP